MTYLLDSNTISERYDTNVARHPTVTSYLHALTDQAQVSIFILSVYELEIRVGNAPDEKMPALRQMITDAQPDFGVYPLSASGAMVFGTLKKCIKEEHSDAVNISVLQFQHDLAQLEAKSRSPPFCMDDAFRSYTKDFTIYAFTV